MRHFGDEEPRLIGSAAKSNTQKLGRSGLKERPSKEPYEEEKHALSSEKPFAHGMPRSEEKASRFQGLHSKNESETFVPEIASSFGTVKPGIINKS